MPKSNEQIVRELVDLVFAKISENAGANFMLLSPALNIVKMKISALDAVDCDNIVDSIHQISHRIERETGILSPYHGIDNASDKIAKL